MNYRITAPADKVLKGTINLTASKSESNRALIIQAVTGSEFEINNLAAAEDTRVLNEILLRDKICTYRETQIYDVGAAGTTMRFLAAFLATKKGVDCVLTGSERMKNRPIAILVNTLVGLGADVSYVEKEGYPPLRIKGKELDGGEVLIDGGISSQYISALLLVSSNFKKGLKIKFKGEITSRPYIDMTVRMMNGFFMDAQWVDNSIVVDQYKNRNIKNTASVINKNIRKTYTVSGDWSSASYWYAIIALSKDSDLYIEGLDNYESSMQADAAVVEIFSALGVKTTQIGNCYHLTKSSEVVKSYKKDFSNCPDIAQTVAVVVAALGIPSTFTGLHTLRIKETDRTAALKNELAKIGVVVDIISDDEIKIIPDKATEPTDSIATYEDHRMAMAFAPLALVKDSISIEHPDVVKKSYPDFWKDLQSVGFNIVEA